MKITLSQAFQIKDLGPLKYFLGLEIARSNKGISVCQRKYALDVLNDAGYLGCKPVSTPMDPTIQLSQDSSNGIPLPDATSYRVLIGKLLYLTITRPDIMFAVHKLSQFLSAPHDIHLTAAYRVLRYLKNDPGKGLFYSVDPDIGFNAFSDSDWATCLHSRKSVTGFCVFLGDSLVSWKSKKQKVASRSSAEAEYRAMADTTKELIWLENILHEMKIKTSGSSNLYCDNTVALHIASNSVFHERTKHVELDCHVVRHRYKDGLLNLMHITTENNLADLFTKPVQPSVFKALMSRFQTSSLFLPS